jgi:hypothetical protein
MITGISSITGRPDIRLFSISGRISGKANPVSGQIPDIIKKSRIIRPDIRPAGYPVHPYKWHFSVAESEPHCFNGFGACSKTLTWCGYYKKI